MERDNHSIFSEPLFPRSSASAPRYASQEEAFMKNLPNTLYLSHYELSQLYNSWTPDEWRRYLKDKERFIMTEIAAMTEASARQALSRLAAGKPTTQEISAIKQLLDRSEQINSQDKDQRTFVMLQFDGTTPKPEGYRTREQVSALMLENDNNIRKLYGLKDMTPDQRDRWEDAEHRVRNGDNTLHFPDPKRMSDLDHAYMRLFNPDNYRTTEIPKFHEPEGFDVQ